MEAYYLLKSGLVVHLIGISMVVGATVASFSTYHHVWQVVYNEKSKALLLIKTATRLRLLQIIGGIFILTGGIMMVSASHGFVTQQTWFKIKMIVLLLIVLNPFLIARPAAIKLLKTLDHQKETASEAVAINGIKRKLNWFHILQLLFFLVIFILSAFRFN